MPKKNGGSLNKLFEVLSHEDCLLILKAVAQHDQKDDADITLETIAGLHEQDSDKRELLKQQLYHVYLPMLDNKEFVDWNRDTGLITRGSRFGEFESFLKLMREHQGELPEGWP